MSFISLDANIRSIAKKNRAAIANVTSLYRQHTLYIGIYMYVIHMYVTYDLRCNIIEVTTTVWDLTPPSCQKHATIGRFKNLIRSR